MSGAADTSGQIARAVLYEGHILYPYRRSALKNRRPWSFGTLAPEPWATHNWEPSTFHSEVLVLQTAAAFELCLTLRFLHLSRTTRPGPAVEYGEAMEREVSLDRCTALELLGGPAKREFHFSSDEKGGAGWGRLAGSMEIRAESVRAPNADKSSVNGEVLKLFIQTRNDRVLAAGASRDEALLASMVAAHAGLQVSGGEFVSLMDPPALLAAAAAGCRNSGVFPVLVGSPERRDQALVSPIILYDFPQIAAESVVAYCDATEIDEMLALRVLTLSELEKAELRAAGGRGRAILERTEALLPDELVKTHGVLRDVSVAGEK
ncbi:MAG: hypothetical protein JO041_10290 [Acidobacteria bacterium]|nr:hypothetical protein [Acidobacteriota bacterium]